MRILSSSEVEELSEHLAARPDIWLEHQGCWIRQTNRAGEPPFALAVKLRNGIAHGMYAMTISPLDWDRELSEAYGLWLLEKYTAYCARMKIVQMLELKTKYYVDVDALSRDLCELHGGPFLRKHLR